MMPTIGRRARGRRSAVAHLDPPRERGRDVAVVGDDHDRRALGVQFMEQLHDGVAGAAVEVAGRFVGEHDRRVVDHRAGDGDTLTFTARELVGEVVEAMTEPDAVECLDGARRRRTASVTPGVQQPVGDVVERRHAGEQEELLEHEADAARTHGRELAVAERDASIPSMRTLPGGGPVEGAHHVQHRRLPRSGGPDDRQQLAVFDPQRDAVEGVHGRIAGIRLGDVDQFQRGVGGAAARSSPSSRSPRSAGAGS